MSDSDATEDYIDVDISHPARCTLHRRNDAVTFRTVGSHGGAKLAGVKVDQTVLCFDKDQKTPSSPKQVSDYLKASEEAGELAQLRLRPPKKQLSAKAKAEAAKERAAKAREYQEARAKDASSAEKQKKADNKASIRWLDSPAVRKATRAKDTLAHASARESQSPAEKEAIRREDNFQHQVSWARKQGEVDVRGKDKETNEGGLGETTRLLATLPSAASAGPADSDLPDSDTDSVDSLGSHWWETCSWPESRDVRDEARLNRRTAPYLQPVAQLRWGDGNSRLEKTQGPMPEPQMPSVEFVDDCEATSILLRGEKRGTTTDRNCHNVYVPRWVREIQEEVRLIRPADKTLPTRCVYTWRMGGLEETWEGECPLAIKIHWDWDILRVRPWIGLGGQERYSVWDDWASGNKLMGLGESGRHGWICGDTHCHHTIPQGVSELNRSSTIRCGGRCVWEKCRIEWSQPTSQSPHVKNLSIEWDMCDSPYDQIEKRTQWTWT